MIKKTFEFATEKKVIGLRNVLENLPKNCVCFRLKRKKLRKYLNLAKIFL